MLSSQRCPNGRGAISALLNPINTFRQFINLSEQSTNFLEMSILNGQRRILSLKNWAFAIFHEVYFDLYFEEILQDVVCGKVPFKYKMHPLGPSMLPASLYPVL